MYQSDGSTYGNWITMVTPAITLPANSTVTALFTCVKVNGGSGDIELEMGVLDSGATTVLDYFLGNTAGKRAVQTMGPFGDKVTATFSSSYTFTAGGGDFRFACKYWNSYGGNWPSARADLIVMVVKK